jgi:hypothetical protein
MEKRSIKINNHRFKKTTQDNTYTGHSKPRSFSPGTRVPASTYGNGWGDEQASVSGKNSGYGSQSLETLSFKKIKQSVYFRCF